MGKKMFEIKLLQQIIQSVIRLDILIFYIKPVLRVYFKFLNCNGMYICSKMLGNEDLPLFAYVVLR